MASKKTKAAQERSDLLDLIYSLEKRGAGRPFVASQITKSWSGAEQHANWLKINDEYWAAIRRLVKEDLRAR